jgi:hypothetical protein
MRRDSQRVATLGVAAILAAACGSEEPPAPRVPEAISALLGDNQQAQVGTQLPISPTFLVTDRQGPLPGVAVAFTVSDASGFVSPTSATTGADGRASATWTVGGSLGQQTLTAAVAGITPVSVRASVTAGPATLVFPVSRPSQFVVVGRLVTENPAVRVTDAFGNSLAGQSVSFTDPTGRTQVTGASSTTDASGVTGVTSWRLPNQPGSFSLIASIDNGATTTFVAVGIPAATQVIAGNGQSANAGTRVPVAPAVMALDDQAQPLPDVGVTFRVTEGNGRLLSAAPVKTGPDGIARSPGWVLGLTPGPNALAAEILGTPSLEFTATGLQAVPAATIPLSPTALTGVLGNFVTPTPALRVSDAQGQPVAGTAVSFAVSSGQGTLTYANRMTDFQGEARLGAWRLGTAAPVQTLTASPASLPPVAFTANALPPPAPAYKIEVRFIGPPPTAAQQAAFDDAAARWQQAVLGDLDDVPFAEDLSDCGGEVIDETIDDLLIFASIDHIDGPGDVLGFAGACWLRDDNLLSVVGLVKFDSDDVRSLEAQGVFRDVVLHEMGHVIGIGSLWQLFGLVVGRGGSDPFFRGASARAAFAAADPTESFTGNVVPVENLGGGGTRDVHWREGVATNELMTGFLDATNPLSAFTIGSLRDQGYQVNDAAADPFTLAAALRSLAATPPIRLHEGRWTTPVRTVGRRGGVRRVILPLPAPYR